MRDRHVLLVAGARPNFVKIAPVMRALDAVPGLRQTLVHTGQHYDDAMSKVFFDELGLRAPDVDLGVGSGTCAAQVERVTCALAPVLAADRPDLVVVVGDVNGTLAAAVAAAKAAVPCAHVEAGLRSFDPRMPEETNRRVTDRLSRLLLTPSADADDNLRREGVPAERIVRVGNVMIDTLRAGLPRARDRDAPRRLGLPARYALATAHRPSNVDADEALRETVEALEAVARRIPLVFPVHPRTRARLKRAGLDSRLIANERIVVLGPLGYLDFLSVMNDAAVVLTDSGGIQEETTALGIPCLTLRENTERPVTLSEGTNVLVGRDREVLRRELARALDLGVREPTVPALWDGRAADRVAAVVRAFLDDGNRRMRRRSDPGACGLGAAGAAGGAVPPPKRPARRSGAEPGATFGGPLAGVPDR